MLMKLTTGQGSQPSFTHFASNIIFCLFKTEKSLQIDKVRS